MEVVQIALVLHPRNDVTEVAERAVAVAAELGAEVLVRAADARRVPGAVPVSTDELAAECDGVLSLGGDGTMLGALRLVADRPVPVLGVHLGNLGFLVEVTPAELDSALPRLIRGDFTEEPHSALRITAVPRVDSAGSVSGTDRAIAFNDLALARRPGRGQVDATLSVNGLSYGFYRSDALVVATPAGSSAYSYAAGGPLVSPSVDGVVVTPSAPMSGISRPLVVAGTDALTFDLTPRCGTLAVEVDGIGHKDVTAGDRVHVTAEPHAGRVVRLDPDLHARRSRVKLSLLDLPLLPEQLRELLPADVRDRLEARDH
ncbi:NAD(+)/NADH kinase [Pseudonocardia oroxyli]|uniref:NAD kinase n=1 Tax=Pseudonocardia oroxyli TaxID=366584 RepID=A0A1G7YQS9_PSEOR|nr:NAD(+)/NADH kinase [Pseudonocardia oroxyli]SDG98685.1 NAD+ kinase [Pseudonocardia oroxyli]